MPPRDSLSPVLCCVVLCCVVLCCVVLCWINKQSKQNSSGLQGLRLPSGAVGIVGFKNWINIKQSLWCRDDIFLNANLEVTIGLVPSIPAGKTSIDRHRTSIKTQHMLVLLVTGHQQLCSHTTYAGLAGDQRPARPAYVVFWCWSILVFPAGMESLWDFWIRFWHIAEYNTSCKHKFMILTGFDTDKHPLWLLRHIESQSESEIL